jgi:hypothetical protein
VLMVWRMSRPVDPAAVMRCAFTDSRRLPDWQERRTKTEDRDGFPSAAISGTYTFGELSLWVSTRYLMAGTPTGQYLLQLSVTTRADDDRDGRFIAGSLGVQSPIMQPAPAAHALRSEPSGPHTRPEPVAPPRRPEPPAPLAWPDADPALRPERTGSTVAWSDSPDSDRHIESTVAWSEPLEAVGESESAGMRTHAVRSELAGEEWSREPAPLARSEAPDPDGVEAVGGAWSESVTAGAQSEPATVLREALLPVPGAEPGPAPEDDAHQSGNVDFHI